MDLVHDARERPQHRFGVGGVGRLPHQPAAGHDDGVGGKDDPVVGDLTRDVLSFRPRHAQRVARAAARPAAGVSSTSAGTTSKSNPAAVSSSARRGEAEASTEAHGQLMIAAPESARSETKWLLVSASPVNLLDTQPRANQLRSSESAGDYAPHPATEFGRARRDHPPSAVVAGAHDAGMAARRRAGARPRDDGRARATAC